MIVVDASALANALTDDGEPGRQARAELGRDDAWVAPEYLRPEVFSVIRGRWLGGKVPDERAGEAVQALRDDLAITTVDTRELLTMMWELRSGCSGYDAGYVAAAFTTDSVLVTADGRLARAAEGACRVNLVASEV